MYADHKLIEAICNGNLALVKQCHESGVDINCNIGWLEAPALQYAIYYKQDTIVQWLCDHAANTNYFNRSGYTPLQSAVLFATPNIVQLLQSYGVEFETPHFEAAYFGKLKNASNIDVSIKDSAGLTLLHYAAVSGQTGTVSWLLDNGANLSERMNNGATALMLAAAKGHTAIVSWLLEHGASLKEETYPGETALLLAAENGHTEMVSWLLEHGASLMEETYRGETALLLAAENGHTEMLPWLLEHGASLEEETNRGETALLLAARHGHTKTASCLLAYGASLAEKDDRGTTALLVAAMMGHTEMVSWLLEHGSSLMEKTYRGETALLLAAANGHAEMVSWLLEHDASLMEKTKPDETALLLAAANGHTEMVSWLLERGANLMEETYRGETALLLAAANGHTEMVSWLLEHGASLEEETYPGKTALLLAARHGHTKTVSCLLAYGASLAEKDNRGTTALLVAAMMGHTEMVSWLLEKGASLTEKTNSGETALLLAAANGHTEMVSWLLEHGASLKEETYRGETALSLATAKGHIETVWLLLDKGVSLSKKDNNIGTTLILAIKYEHFLLAQFLLLHHGNVISSNDRSTAFFYIRKFNRRGVIAARLECCMSPQFPYLHVVDSTLIVTVTADTLTAAQWLDIIELLEQYPTITTLHIKGGLFVVPKTMLEVAPLVNRQLSTLIWSDAVLNVDSLAWLVPCWQANFVSLTELRLTGCQLVNDAVHHLEPLFSLCKLNTLDLTGNVLGYDGVNELLRYARKTTLKTLLLADNFIYVGVDETNKLKTQLQKTPLSHCDVSMNYLLQSTKGLFFKPDGLDDNVACLNSMHAKVKYLSLLLDNDENRVSREQWNVFLFRDDGSEDGAHARILVEGVRGFGQRFITQYDFRPTESSFIYTVRGQVESREYAPRRLFENIETLHFKAYSVTRITAKMLIRFMKADKEKVLHYNKKGGGRDSKCSNGQAYNCFTWAIAKLVEASIITRNEFPILVPYPPFYLQGRHASKRQLLSGVTEEQIKNSSPPSNTDNTILGVRCPFM